MVRYCRLQQVLSSSLLFFSCFCYGRCHVASEERRTRHIYRVRPDPTNRNGPRGSQPPPFSVLTNDTLQQLFALPHRLLLIHAVLETTPSFRVLPPNSDGFGASLSLSRQSIANSSPTQTLRDLFGLVISRNLSIPDCRVQSESTWPSPPPSQKKKSALGGKSQESATYPHISFFRLQFCSLI